MEVQVAITMKESLGQNHARNRLSVLPRRCSILEVGEPGDFTRNGIRKKSWFGVVMRELKVGLGSSARAMIGARVVTPIRSVAVALREF